MQERVPEHLTTHSQHCRTPHLCLCLCGSLGSSISLSSSLGGRSSSSISLGLGLSQRWLQGQVAAAATAAA